MKINNQTYIIGIDQSTQGTKALLFDQMAKLISREDLPHEQKISKEGYVSHDPVEIYKNTVQVVRNLLTKYGIDGTAVKAIGISNQRETTVAWNKVTGEPVCDAIVWQCARAVGICETILKEDGAYVQDSTGIPLSPYFPAAKMAWILNEYPLARELMDKNQLCFGTVDSWLLYSLTKGKSYATDYSNASRTQLMNLEQLCWDEKILSMFGISLSALPKICDSNSWFGDTDFDGLFSVPVPIQSILGDSHGALFGQSCHSKGMVKATYGTGSSLMMNTGTTPIKSKHGIVSSVAWGMDGQVFYVLEGNLNYTGAVISWLKEDLMIISSALETEELAKEANSNDSTYLVPAFSGLGAPYWNSTAKAVFFGMSRTTGRKELVKAGLECIGYQITDLLLAMEKDSGTKIETLCVDGGPTRNTYLMQFQSDLANIKVAVPNAEELSGIGVAYMAGITIGFFDKKLAFSNLHYMEYVPLMNEDDRTRKYAGWLEAVQRV